MPFGTFGAIFGCSVLSRIFGANLGHVPTDVRTLSKLQVTAELGVVVLHAWLPLAGGSESDGHVGGAYQCRA